ncbi:hypothetical protein HU200_022634 [Digitaria exilis]|uniref:Probable cinnamyl alcohol dehydrogenase n=1 Tax=Digitaria exilis TaxID=1010633 RepID=A0A835C2F6_9POAL|nr:hypothetical protein HU200_022634 [Digitaria exilis]
MRARAEVKTWVRATRRRAYGVTVGDAGASRNMQEEGELGFVVDPRVSIYLHKSQTFKDEEAKSYQNLDRKSYICAHTSVHMASESGDGNCDAWAARDPSGVLSPYKFNRRAVQSGDVSLKITHCGVCYADVIWSQNRHNDSKYPLVPGHEIAGIVIEVGSDVKGFKVGDHVGVGTYVNSCRDCENCNSSLENHCPKSVYTFNGIDTDGTVTKGGYSTHIVVHERYCFKIPDGYPLAKAAPLLCAGVTVYNPMVRHSMNQPGKSLGVIGLGGLGHMAVKFGKAFGLKVTVFSTSESKRDEAINILRADNFVISSNTQQMESLKSSLHFIIDTASGGHPFDPYLSLLKVNGVMAIVGFPSEIKMHPASLNLGARTLSGSITGGTKDIQEMVNFCAENKIYPEVEIIKIDYINEALKRLVNRDLGQLKFLQLAGRSRSGEMAGLIASGIIKWTASKLSSLVSAPIGSSSSSDEEQTSAVRDVQMLQRTMASVQRTLEAADEDSIREVSGRLRLRELQQFAYDAQDAIDEYKFELLRRRMDDPDGHREDRSTRKRKRKGDKKEPETDPVVVPVPDELANRVKRILERFKEMTKAWDDLKLDEADAPLREEEEDFVPGPTTPHVDEPTIIGRGEDILKLDTQYMLYLNDTSQNLRYLSLAVSSLDHTTLDLRNLPVTGGIRMLQVINAMDDNKRYYSSLLQNNRRCFSKLFSHHINIMLPEDLKGLRHLRALDLSRSALTSLPESIGELKLLRYLCIFQTRIAKLPESICGLHNLKVLDARTNMLGELPQDIQKLVSLQHLSLELWSTLCMPRGIGMLKRLKTLTRFSVGVGNWHCNIAELHHLVNIHGELCITGLGRVTNIDDAQTANLISKKYLQILRLDWSAGFCDIECEHIANQNNPTSTPELDEDVFDSLKPHRNIEELEVINYSGYKYPSWLGDPAFSCLAKVTLWKQKCKFLPALGQLPQLRELVIIHMECVERIGQEFYGQDSVDPFPALEKLEFQDMPNWVEWDEVSETDFPSLCELKIKDSNELRVLPQKLPSHLKKLVIINCEKVVILPIVPCLAHLVLKGNINEETTSCLHFPLLRALKACFLTKAEEIKLENMPMLEGLAIVGCKRLFSIEGLWSVESLSLLKIIDCPNLQLPLKPLPQKVQQCTVTNCPQLHEWAEWQQAQMSETQSQIFQTQSQEPDGASYDQEVLETLRDDSEDDFKVLSEDEDDDDFYDRMFEVGQSSGMAIDYNDDSDDAC